MTLGQISLGTGFIRLTNEPNGEEYMQKVSIVGLGYVGTVLAACLCEKGLSVHGIDVDEETVDKIGRGTPLVSDGLLPALIGRHTSDGRFRVTTDMSVVRNTDVILVTVGTPLNEDHSPDMTEVETACRCIAKYLRRQHLVILRSTVVPGTTDEVILPILENESGLKAGEGFMLAFCPERWGEGTRMTDFEGGVLEEFNNVPVIVGGVDSRSTGRATEFWNSLGMDTVRVSSSRAAELAKLADNWWIDLNIAIANELALLCERMQVDSCEVIEAANTLPKNRSSVNILLPGCGVGGSCLPKDPWFVHYLGRKYGLELKTCRLSREINDRMPIHMYGLITQALEDNGRGTRDARIAVLGLAFKQSTGDTRNTPAAPLIRLLTKNGAEVRAFDPWVGKEEGKKVAGECLVDSLEEALKGSDCIALVSAQPEFRRISFDEIRTLVASPCAVVDGRRAFSSEEVRRNGFTYWAIGLGKGS